MTLKEYRIKTKKKIEQKFRKLKSQLNCFEYGKKLFEINKVLFYFDVIGVAVGNAIVDEYDSEANTICIGLKICKSKKDVLELIKETFNISFDRHYDSKDFIEVAEKLWKIKQEYY